MGTLGTACLCRGRPSEQYHETRLGSQKHFPGQLPGGHRFGGDLWGGGPELRSLKGCLVWRAAWPQAEPGWGVPGRHQVRLWVSSFVGRTQVAGTLRMGAQGEPGRNSSWTGGHLQALLRSAQDKCPAGLFGQPAHMLDRSGQWPICPNPSLTCGLHPRWNPGFTNCC